MCPWTWASIIFSGWCCFLFLLISAGVCRCIYIASFIITLIAIILIFSSSNRPRHKLICADIKCTHTIFQSTEPSKYLVADPIAYTLLSSADECCLYIRNLRLHCAPLSIVWGSISCSCSTAGKLWDDRYCDTWKRFNIQCWCVCVYDIIVYKTLNVSSVPFIICSKAKPSSWRCFSRR